MVILFRWFTFFVGIVLPGILVAAVPKANFPSVPAPPYSSVFWIAQYVEQNTVPMQIIGFKSTEPHVSVVKFYEQWFKDKLLFTKNSIKDGQIFGAKTGIYQITVKLAFLPEGADGTIIVAAMYDQIKNVQERKALIGKGFPAPFGSNAISDSVSYDEGSKNRTIIFVNQNSIETNTLYIREEMIKLGWVLSTDQTIKGGESSVTVMRKTGAEITITIVRQLGQTILISSQTERD